MPTNLLNLPNYTAAFKVGTNESWRDSVPFISTGAVSAYPAIGNVGAGQISVVTAAMGTPTGNYVLTFTNATNYSVADPNGAVIGTGTLLMPFSGGGLSFTLSPGFQIFAAGDSYTLAVMTAPIDLTGIRLVMQMRAAAGQAQILLSADSASQTIINGGTTGVIAFAVPASTMQSVPPSPDGSPYVFDVLAIADGDQRQCLTGTCAVVAGITQLPTA